MLCEKCRIREANIKYTEVMNGVKTEHNLCSQCAQEMDFGPYSAIIEGEFPLGKLLSSLLGLQPSAARQQKMDEVACPTCKTTYEAVSYTHLDVYKRQTYNGIFHYNVHNAVSGSCLINSFALKNVCKFLKI